MNGPTTDCIACHTDFRWRSRRTDDPQRGSIRRWSGREPGLAGHRRTVHPPDGLSRFGRVLVAGQASDDSLQEVLRGVGNFVHGSVEGFFVGRRRLAIAADLADELERGRTDLLVTNDFVAIS